MAKYEVIHAWDNVTKVGDVIELSSLHPSLVYHVKLIRESDTAPEKALEVATPRRGRPPKDHSAE